MCDEHTEQDNVEFLRRRGVSRRGLGALASGAGLAMMLPRAANAVDVAEADVTVTTPDGEADCHFAHPAGAAAAGVLVWPDIFGLRPAFKMMGRRLAEQGYAVLTVNPFYRDAVAPVVPEGATFQSAGSTLMPLMQSLTPERTVTDAKAFTAWLDAQDAVDTSKPLGTTGYCMGGPFTLRTAAAVPDRVGAGGSFHGANLANDMPDSPHLLVPQMKARFLIAIAANDDERDPNAKVLLRQAFDAAMLPAEIEVYEGTMHGWCPPDSQVYDEAQAEHAWTRLLATFGEALV